MKYNDSFEKIKAFLHIQRKKDPIRDRRGKNALGASLLVLFLSLAVIGILFYITYRWDNKYTYTGSSLHVLAGRWEFYPDLSLEENRNTEGDILTSPEIITIGQFGNFKSFHQDASPFGSAVYRKQLYLEPTSGGWLLEMPEIYSASKIYINGKLLHSYGDLSEEHYRIHTQNTLIPLPSGNVEIVIEASNYSHYYSGVVYPPIIGRTDTVTLLIICRLVFYAFLCFFTLGCAVVSFTVWFRRQTDTLYAAYGLLCLCFSVHICYPLIHWLGINLGELSYVIEDTAYFAVLVCMTALTYRLAGSVWNRKVYIACYIFSIVMTAFPLLAFYMLFPLFPPFISIYSQIIALSKIVMSVYLILAAFLGTLQQPQYVWLLSGNAVFGFGILVDYLTAGRYEPVRFGWQTEYCGFVMVLLFTILISDYNRRALIQRQYLTEHLQEEVEKKTAHLTAMMEERKQFLSAVAHDLKAPVAAINTYIDYIKSSGIDSDDELQHYLDVIDNKSSQIQNNVQSLQLFHTETSHRDPAEFLDCSEFLRYVYSETLPYADANGLHYQLELPKQTCQIYGHRENLFRVFENLVINATEHTPMEGTLTLSAVYTNDTVQIIFKDNGEGIAPEYLPQIFNYEFSTKKNPGLRGLGLYFTRISIEEYGGTITVNSRPGEGTAFHICIPLSFKSY